MPTSCHSFERIKLSVSERKTLFQDMQTLQLSQNCLEISTQLCSCVQQQIPLDTDPGPSPTPPKRLELLQKCEVGLVFY